MTEFICLSNLKVESTFEDFEDTGESFGTSVFELEKTFGISAFHILNTT